MYEKEQALVLKNLMSSENRGMTLRVLFRMGKLEPIPEIHWRVDRSMEEYNRRFEYGSKVFAYFARPKSAGL